MRWITETGRDRDIVLPEFWHESLYVTADPTQLEFALGAKVLWADIRGNCDASREAVGRILVWRQSRGWQPGEPAPINFYRDVYRDLLTVTV
jgi:hypothetical protein